MRRLQALLPTPSTDAHSVSATPPVRDTPTLERLHGMGEAVRWGVSLCADLVEYRAGRLSWADVDAGMLLSGPPGTGKTTFARALASSCSVTLVSGSYGEWIGSGSGHQGDLIRSMRKTFAEARSKAPCILFLDEVDSFRDRSDVSDRNSEWNTQVLNSLLAEMDGVVGREGVVVIGACNDPSRLDAALVRAGRLDRHVEIELPSEADLGLILREHLRGDLVHADLAGVASSVVGATGADVEQMVRDGRRLARAARSELKMEHLMAAVFGADGRSPEELWRSAVHEAGHAVLSHGQSRLSSVNIRLVRGAGGQTVQTPASMVPTDADLFAEILVAMGGRAAERVVLGTLLPGSGGGPASDLGRATLMAARMVGAMGLDAEVGPLWLGDMNARTLPKALARSPVLRCRVRAMLDEAEHRASEILGRNQSGLRAVARALVRCRALSAEDLASILSEQAGGPVHATRSGATSSETRPERTGQDEVHHVAG